MSLKFFSRSSTRARSRSEPARVLVVHGQGRTDGLSHRIVRRAVDTLRAVGAEIRVQDLLSDGFDPVLRLPMGARHALPEHSSPLARRYQADVQWMQALLIVHPVWWFGPPAILKGWVDQVLLHSVAIEQVQEGNPKPLLRGRRALVIQTFGAKRIVDRTIMKGIAGTFWKRAVFLPVGIFRSTCLAFHGVQDIAEEDAAAMDARVEAAARRLAGG